MSFDSTGQSRTVVETRQNQSTLQNVEAGYQSIVIDNNGDVPIIVEYPGDEERNFDIPAGGNARLFSEAYNGLPTVNVLPGTIEGEEVNEFTLTLQKFV